MSKLEMARLADLKAKAEMAYDDMYEVHSFEEANTCYRDAKDYFVAAITLAKELNLTEECEALHQRLAHVQAVFRSQFVPR
jgi:hypothetical protein